MTNFGMTNENGGAGQARCEAGTMSGRGVTTMRTVIGLLALLVLAPAASAQTAKNVKRDDEQALRLVELQMARGEQENDWSKMSASFSDDWVGLGPRAISRTEIEQMVKHAAEEHGSNPYTVEKKDMRVDVFGDTAVVTYTKEYRQRADTSKVAREDDTDVFTRSPAGWLLNFTRTSPVWPPPTSQ
jgi:ketosteroid isomerase-like protein